MPREKREATVGDLRQQTALCNADRRVVLVQRLSDGSCKATSYRVVSVYPDTTDEHGKWISSFKIEIEEV